MDYWLLSVKCLAGIMLATIIRIARPFQGEWNATLGQLANVPSNVAAQNGFWNK